MCIYAYMYAYIHICACICMYTCVYIYMCAYTHIHMSLTGVTHTGYYANPRSYSLPNKKPSARCVITLRVVVHE